jgi:type I restriction enzyme S subunit
MIGSAGQQRVLQEFFSKFCIAVIDMDSQRAIAAILDTVDEAIQQTEALIEKLKRMKAGLLHDLLTGRVRVPEGLLQRFQDTHTMTSGGA